MSDSDLDFDLDYYLSLKCNVKDNNEDSKPSSKSVNKSEPRLEMFQTQRRTYRIDDDDESEEEEEVERKMNEFRDFEAEEVGGEESYIESYEIQNKEVDTEGEEEDIQDTGNDSLEEEEEEEEENDEDRDFIVNDDEDLENEYENQIKSHCEKKEKGNQFSLKEYEEDFFQSEEEEEREIKNTKNQDQSLSDEEDEKKEHQSKEELVQLDESTNDMNESTDENMMDEDSIKQFEKYIEKAREFKEDYDYISSMKYFQRALALSPNDVQLQKKIEKLQVIVDEIKNGDGYYRNKAKEQYELKGGFALPVETYENIYVHQREGVKWLWKRHTSKVKGAFLGDDMGLGKTIQIVTFLRGLFEAGEIRSVLIVMPKVVLENWNNEFKKWYEKMRCTMFHGNGNSKFKSLEKVQQKGGVCLTTYGMIRSNFEKLTLKGEHEWDYIILDEGHLIKNPNCQISQLLRSMKSIHRIILSGTPVQNNLGELWALFDFLTDGELFGSQKDFKLNYEHAIVKATDREASLEEKAMGEAIGQNLREVIKPFLLRREKKTLFGESQKEENKIIEESTKKEKSNDSCKTMNDKKESGREKLNLPKLESKRELIVWNYLSEKQIELYDSFLNSDEVSQVLNQSASPLAALQVLNSICDHPGLLSKSTETCASLLLKQYHYHGDENIENLIQDSGKLQFLMKLLNYFKKENNRVLIFSQSKVMLNIIQAVLSHKKYKFHRIDGDVVDRFERQRYIDEFNQDDSYFCFLLTTDVGGIGITLTGADRVIIFHPSWNPAKDGQAVDRAYRVGQKKKVVVYRFVTCGTIEEKILRKQIFKTALMKIATNKGKNTRYFTKQELSEIFQLNDPRVSQTQLQLEKFHQATTKSNHASLHQFLPFATNDDIFGVSDHDLLYSMNDDSINDELMEQILQAIQETPQKVQKNKEDKENVPNKPKDPKLQSAKKIPIDQEMKVILEDLIKMYRVKDFPCNDCGHQTFNYLSTISSFQEGIKRGNPVIALNFLLESITLCPHDDNAHFVCLELGKMLQIDPRVSLKRIQKNKSKVLSSK